MSVAVFVVAVLFSATIVRSALGFGEALLAVPLLAFVLPVDVAAPVAVLVSITVAAIVLLRDWRHVELGAAVRLTGFTLIGVPVGLFALRTIPAPIVKATLGLVVAGFALFSMWQQRPFRLADDRLAWLFGVSRYYLLSLPAVVLAIPLGRRINRRLDPRRFLTVIHIGLFVSGAALFAHALISR